MRMRIRTGKTTYKSIISVLFPISLFVDNYMFPGTNNTPLGTTIIILISLFLLIKNRRFNTKEKNNIILIVLAVYLLVDQFIVLLKFSSYISFDSNVRQLIINIAMIFAIITIPRYVDFEVFYKVYSFLVIISCVGLLFQSIQVYVLHGTTRMIVIPGMYDLLSPGSKRYIDALYNRMRPSSFFTEPSLFANYTIPMIILALKKKNYKYAVFVTVCNILTTSTTGIFLSVAIWMYWIFFEVKKKWVKSITAIMFVASCVIVIQSSFFWFSLNKITSTDFRSNERVASGITVFLQMPPADKVTGVGLENVSNYISHENINMTNVMVTADGYVTSAFGNFVKIGIIGGVLYLLLCIRMLKVKNRYAVLLAVIIIMLSFIQTLSFNSGGVWWFVIYAVLRKNAYQSETISVFSKGN